MNNELNNATLENTDSTAQLLEAVREAYANAAECGLGNTHVSVTHDPTLVDEWEAFVGDEYASFMIHWSEHNSATPEELARDIAARWLRELDEDFDEERDELTDRLPAGMKEVAMAETQEEFDDAFAALVQRGEGVDDDYDDYDYEEGVMAAYEKACSMYNITLRNFYS